MKYIAMIVAVLMTGPALASEKEIGKDAIAYPVCIEGYLFVVVEKDTYNGGGVAITQVHGWAGEKSGGRPPQPIKCSG